MAEYIEREAVIAAMNKEGYTRNMRIHKAVLAIPAADVAPVVLCKDCKHSYEDLCGRVCAYGVSVDCVVPDEYFCADGVREEQT